VINSLLPSILPRPTLALILRAERDAIVHRRAIIGDGENAMGFEGSVTGWIVKLQLGEEAALGKLHGRYWPQLVALARRRLRGAPAAAADEDDVAQEAFWAFYKSFKAGQVPMLRNRHDLFAVLSHIVACRAVNQIQHEVGTRKRGGGQVRHQSALTALAGSDAPAWDAADANARNPLEQVILQDCYQHYIDELPEELHAFAELHLAGLTNREVAERMGCVERTVERKMALILKRWQGLAAESVNQSAA
jgi:RNA polymerase sigma factor (sigma-70 family)